MAKRIFRHKSVYSPSFPTYIFFFPPSILHLFSIFSQRSRGLQSTSPLSKSIKRSPPGPYTNSTHRTIISISPPRLTQASLFSMALLYEPNAKAWTRTTARAGTLVVDRPGEFDLGSVHIDKAASALGKKGPSFEGRLAGGACCDVS